VNIESANTEMPTLGEAAFPLFRPFLVRSSLIELNQAGPRARGDRRICIGAESWDRRRSHLRPQTNRRRTLRHKIVVGDNRSGSVQPPAPCERTLVGTERLVAGAVTISWPGWNACFFPQITLQL